MTMEAKSLDTPEETRELTNEQMDLVNVASITSGPA